MAMSSKRRRIVLTTSNKASVLLVTHTVRGYGRGFNVLKDVPKTMVFELARYRNTLSPAIPERVIPVRRQQSWHQSAGSGQSAAV